MCVEVENKSLFLSFFLCPCLPLLVSESFSDSFWLVSEIIRRLTKCSTVENY